MDSIRITSFNGRSISALHRLAEIEKYLFEYRPDILFVQETFLTSKICINICGYRTVRRDRGTHGGGVIIFIREDIEYTEYVHERSFKCVEVVTIKLNISVNNILSELLLSNVYVPRANRHLRPDLRQLLKLKNHVLAGDFNAIHANWSTGNENMAGRIIVDILPFNNNLLFAPTQHTHTHHNGAYSTIDFLITNCPYYNDDIAIENGLCSDHLPVRFTIGATKTKAADKLVYMYERADWVYYEQLMKNVPNVDLEISEDIDLALTDFIVQMKNAFDAAVPKRIISTKRESYLSADTRSLLSRKNAVNRRLHNRNITVLDRANLIKARKRLSNNIRESVFDDRCERWGQLIQRMSASKSEFWKLAKIARKKKSSRINAIVRNNRSFTKQKDIANEFSEHFAAAHTFFVPLNNAFDRKIERDFTNLLSSNVAAPAEFFNIDDLLKIVSNLRRSKAPGLDGVTNVMIKRLPFRALEFLLRIFNRTYEISYWPHEFKTAIVIPIHKRGKDVQQVDSYRPVSLLSSLSKLLERLLKLKIDSQAVRMNVLPEQQFGFRAHRSSTQQATNLAATIKLNKSAKKSTGALLLDVAKAFDTVWHAGLAHRMSALGFEQHLVKMLAKFTTGRAFVVRSNGAMSKKQPIPSGLPQGSCLSPGLYNIYTAFARCGEELLTFADDTAVICGGLNGNAIVKRIEKAFGSLERQFAKWHIRINATKTEFLFLPLDRKKRRIPNRLLTLNGVVVEPASSVRYLGVHFNNNCSFSTHYRQMRAKASATIVGIYSLFKSGLLPEAHRLTLVKAVLYPVLFHSMPAWSEMSLTNSKQLASMFQRCARQILGLEWRHPTHELYELLRYTSINDHIANAKDRLYHRLIQFDDPDLNRLAIKIADAWPNAIQ